MTTKILIPSIADLDKAAHEFVELMDDATVFALSLIHISEPTRPY